MPAQPDIGVLKTAADSSEPAAAMFVTQATEAVRTNGRFTLAFSRGSTPKSLSALLATKPGIPWDKVYFFSGDERHVPPTIPKQLPDSHEALLSKIQVPPENMFPIHAKEKITAAAQQYSR